MTNYARRALPAVIAATAALTLAACSAGSDAPTGTDTADGTDTGVDTSAVVRVGLAAIPANLDFTTTGGAAIPQALMGNVYEGLVQLDDRGEIQPLLATDWEVSEDGLTYTFTLQEGVTFHDGAAFTAENVKFSLERVKDWTASSPSNLAALDSVDVISPTEVAVKLSEPDYNTLFWLASPLGAMFDPDSVDNLAAEANGTGPFAFISYDQGVRMELERNDEYWAEPAGVAGIELLYFSDASAAANALRTGGVEALYQVEAYDQVASFEADDAFTVTTGATQGVVVMSMNPDNPALAEVTVRQAISHAVDKEAVLAAATSGYGTILGGPAVPTDPYYQDLAGTYPYDPELAATLLAEAGVTDLALTFTVPNRPYAEAAAQVLQSNLSEVGIDVTLESQEFPAVWLEETFTNHNFDLSITNHVEARNLWSYDDPGYYWSYSSEEAGAAFDQARTATDEAGYHEAITAAVEQIVTDAAGVWLYNTPNIVITTAEVTGLPTNYLGVGIAFDEVSVSS